MILLIGILSAVAIPKFEKRIELEELKAEKEFAHRLWEELELYADIQKEILSVYSKNNVLIVGMRDIGCYITLLSDNSISDDSSDILSIAEDFTIYNIEYNSQYQKMILSVGGKGVLIYDWDGQSSLNITFNMRLLSSYSFSAEFINENSIIVATKNGLELFNF